MPKIFMIAGLGFGDEGKGTITEYLTGRERAHTVVRYNGGAQAAHNVVMPDGRHHTFSQFGSGTLSGADTHLSRFVVIDILALRKEAEALSSIGVSEAFKKLTVERGAALITPYQKATNRLRELIRGKNRHGSCGAGVGETVSDRLSYESSTPTVEDLLNRRALEDKLSFVRELKLKEFSTTDVLKVEDRHMYDAFDMLTLPVRKVADLWMEAAKSLCIVGDDHISSIINKPGAVIFEGAQGMLLDQYWGFHPYTTWTDISFGNAYELLYGTSHKYSTDIQKIGVIRTYLTRHGAGPFPTEAGPQESIHQHLEEKFNSTHAWQGSFRVGHFDMVLLKYALEAIGNVDCLALTHADCLPRLNKMCISYDAPNDVRFVENGRLKKYDHIDLDYQERLGDALLHRSAVRCNYWPINGDFMEILQDMGGVKVGILSRGPTYQDKTSL